ncbi:hypothetical protein B0H13DRAFT_1857841 [Mycena leptocephala]|nr:hypothetical protein B0H13DRAFT_1857841 [Mycena leptocephala]
MSSPPEIRPDNLVSLVLQSKKASKPENSSALERTTCQTRRLNQPSMFLLWMLKLGDASIYREWSSSSPGSQLAASIAKSIEEKRARLGREEWDGVRVKHSDALDGILESLGSQLVPPDFHEHSAASSLFGSQHSEDEEDAHASVPPSPRHSLSSTVHNVRKEKARPIAKRGKLFEILSMIRPSKTCWTKWRMTYSPRLIARRTATSAMDKLLTAQDGTITVMARHLESLAAHYDQMAGALNESEAGEAFSEEDLQDELGEIMTEMLQTQDTVENSWQAAAASSHRRASPSAFVSYRTAFNKLMLEIARRRQYREAAENIVRGMMSQLAAMTQEESQVREHFNSEHGAHLPEDICLCIGNSPTRWEVVPWHGEEFEVLPEIEPDLIAEVSRSNIHIAIETEFNQAKDRIASDTASGTESL